MRGIRILTRRQLLQAGLGVGVTAILGRWPVANAQVGTTYNVGPTRTYKSLFDLYNSVTIRSGDTVLIDGGTTYSNDLFEPPFGVTNLTLRWSGVGATKPVLTGGARVLNNNDKGLIWCRGAGWTIDGLEIANVTSSGGNGAPIVFEGAGVTGTTVRNCLFRNNQLGQRIIGDCTGADWLFEKNEWRNNGIGDGFTHNFYCQSALVTRLTFQHNYSHDCDGGHLFKSRAQENRVLYNRFEEGAIACNACVDIPYGGLLYLIGNILQKELAASGGWHLTYHYEAPSNGGIEEVYLVNNTIRHKHTGPGWEVFWVWNNVGTYEARNNVSYKSGSAMALFSTATVDGKVSQVPTTDANNVNTTSDPGFVNAATLNFRLLAAATTLIDQGSAPGVRQGFNTTPTMQYRHPTSSETRPTSGQIDIGAYEGGDVTPPAPPSGLRVN